MLIGASDDAWRELGIDLQPEQETLESADVFTQLGMEPDVHPLGPLLASRWE